MVISNTTETNQKSNIVTSFSWPKAQSLLYNNNNNNNNKKKKKKKKKKNILF